MDPDFRCRKFHEGITIAFEGFKRKGENGKPWKKFWMILKIMVDFQTTTDKRFVVCPSIAAVDTENGDGFVHIVLLII